MERCARAIKSRSFSLPTFSFRVGLKSRINSVSLMLHCNSHRPFARILKWSHGPGFSFSKFCHIL